MSKMEDLMNYYEFEKENLTSEEQSIILQNTLAKAGLLNEEQSVSIVEREAKNRGKRAFRKRRILIAACITVFAVSAIAFAAAVLQPGFEHKFNPQNEKQEEALSDMFTSIDVEDTDNGVTVRASQIIGDDYNIYIMVDVIAPKGTVLAGGHNYAFNEKHMDISAKNGGRKVSAVYSLDIVKDEKKKDNQVRFILSMNASYEIGSELELSFKDFFRYKTEEEKKEEGIGIGSDENAYKILLFQGDWKFNFKLDYKNSAKSYNMNQDVNIEGVVAKIEKITISPISLTLLITTDGENIPTLNKIRSEMTVEMKNGEVMGIHPSEGAGNQIEEDNQINSTNNWAFRNIDAPTEIEDEYGYPYTQGVIDPAEIEAIYFNGTKINYNTNP